MVSLEGRSPWSTAFSALEESVPSWMKRKTHVLTSEFWFSRRCDIVSEKFCV